MRVKRMLRHRIIAIAWAILFTACTDGVGPPPPPPTGLIVSNPVTAGALAGSSAFGSGVSASVSAADSVADLAYVALPPGTAPDGELATVQNLRTGVAIEVPVGLGGFDPVAVRALAGDTIAVVVRDANGTVVYTEQSIVALARPPVVVRTNPPPRKRDVPLNTSIVVVFSEPIDSATLTGAGVQVRRGSTIVPGTLAFLDSKRVTVLFTPAAPLDPSADYSLVVTEAIRDLQGEALEGAVTVEFRTAATAPSYEEYFVDSDLSLTANNVGDSVTVHATVRVLDGAGNGIEGSVVRFRGSIGRVEPETARAGLDGLTSVHWVFHGTMGFGAGGTAELSACASNSATRCDMYWTVVLVGLNSP